MTGQEKLEALKSVSDFLKDALDLKDNSIVKAIAQATPWAKELAKNGSWAKDLVGAAGDTLPLVAFFLKYAQLLMQERDPGKQGYNACTLAYNRGVEEVFLAQSMRLRELEIQPRRDAKMLSLSNQKPSEIDMVSFRFETATSHDFIHYADGVFHQFAEIIGLEQNITNQLLKSIHQSFFEKFTFIISSS